METTTINSDRIAFFPSTPPGFSWNYGDLAVRLIESGVNIELADRTLILKLSDDSNGKNRNGVELENKRRLHIHLCQHK